MRLNARCLRSLLVPVFVALVPALAIAGPPLLCFPLSIGSATSLPWGTGGGWRNPLSDYDRTQLVRDTLSALTPSTPTLVRMETLRRATIYASADADLAARVLAALRARATNAPTAGAMTSFDFGYAIEAMRQAQHSVRDTLPVPADDGLAVVRTALAARPTDAAMQYAAALMNADKSKDAAGRHLQAAVDGAAQDANLARTLAAHADLWGGRLPTARLAATR